MRSVQREIVESSGRTDAQGGGVIGGCPVDRRPGLRLVDSLVSVNRRLWPRSSRIIDARAFDIPRAESSRGDRSDEAHALLPADIFSSTVQLGALPETRGQRPYLRFSSPRSTRVFPYGPAADTGSVLLYCARPCFDGCVDGKLRSVRDRLGPAQSTNQRHRAGSVRARPHPDAPSRSFPSCPKRIVSPPEISAQSHRRTNPTV
jgi:hypothetical protein